MKKKWMVILLLSRLFTAGTVSCETGSNDDGGFAATMQRGANEMQQWIGKNSDEIVKVGGAAFLGAGLLYLLQKFTSDESSSAVSDVEHTRSAEVSRKCDMYCEKLDQMRAAQDSGDLAQVMSIFSIYFATNLYLEQRQCKLLGKYVRRLVNVSAKGKVVDINIAHNDLDQLVDTCKNLLKRKQNELCNKQPAVGGNSGDTPSQSLSAASIAQQDTESTLSHLASVLATPEGLALLALGACGAGALYHSNSKEPNLFEGLKKLIGYTQITDNPQTNDKKSSSSVLSSIASVFSCMC